MASKDNPINEILARNVDQVIEKDHLEKALVAGKKLRIKFGIDPTSPDLHLGHAVVLWKLRQFQEAGCVAVLVIGDFTGQIGDPSGRDKTRMPLTAAQVKENMRDYLKQAEKILDMKKTEITYNSKWLGELQGPKLLELLGLVSMQQIVEREDFQKRLAAHQPIRMHELLYPIMQGYDSVAIKADVELGGTDQTFNLLMGRTLMEKFSMKPQDILTVPIIEGTDGERKMSKSLGNYIGLNDEPNDMFGKVMSLPDKLVHRYFLLCTKLSEAEIKTAEKELGPKELKERLGFEIVKLYHGEKSAASAKNNFEKLFSKKEIPDDIPELKLKSGSLSALDLVLAADVVKSKSEGRRLIEQGGLEVDKKVISDPQENIRISGGEVIKVGKRRFFKVKTSK